MENTAKYFALQLGSLASLYLSLSFLLVLLFGVINITFPDAADRVWELDSATRGIRIGIAMVLVFFPTYLVLTRIVNKNRRSEQDGSYIGLTKWLIYLSLLVGGAVLLGDLVAVIMAFLEGEITARFILKAMAVIVIIGPAFVYYISDAKGYWIQNESKSKIFALVASVVVTLALIAGFVTSPSPAEVREMRIDSNMITALQNIQWRVEDYYQTNKTIPVDLEAAYNGLDIPTAPTEREPYQYEVTGETTYKLCATFARDVSINSNYNYPMYEINYNWDYRVGYYCFERELEKRLR